MALRAVTPRRPGQPELPDRAGEQGHSASAALSARVGRAPGSRLRLRGPRLRLRGPRALIFVVLGIVLSAAAASAMPTGQDRVHQQLAAPQGWRRSFWELCPPGYHVSADGNNCTPCANGVEFTTHWNVLPSCLPCTTCKSGEEESTPCTITKDTQCQCRAGTFHGEDSPEFCQKCSTGCPDGMIVAKRCTPWSDLQCVDQKLGTQANGEALVPGKPKTMSPGPPTTPSPSSGNSQLVPGIETAFALLVLVLVLMAAYCFRKFIPQGVVPGRNGRPWPPLSSPQSSRSSWPGSDLVPCDTRPPPTSPAPVGARITSVPHLGCWVPRPPGQVQGVTASS